MASKPLDPRMATQDKEAVIEKIEMQIDEIRAEQVCHYKKFNLVILFLLNGLLPFLNLHNPCSYSGEKQNGCKETLIQNYS